MAVSIRTSFSWRGGTVSILLRLFDPSYDCLPPPPPKKKQNKKKNQAYQANAQNYQNVRVGYLLVLYVNFSVKGLKFVPKCHFPIFSLIWWPFFVTIAAVKVKLIPDFNTWAIVLMKLVKKDFFCLIKRPKQPLNTHILASFRS